ncbi:MAG: protein kinase [Myxococcales bacterium]|nr:protein kinase [Myxococcales bacterium]
MLFPGKSTGSWLIDDLVGLGMPRTYKARHVEVGSECRLKVLPKTDSTLAAQKREVQALRTLHHEAIPGLLDYGVDTQRNLVWTAFAWFDAEPLEDQLLSGPMPWQDACALFRVLADAVSHIHSAGLLHRDLRPKNVLVTASGSTSPDAWLAGFDYAMTQQQLERLSHAPFGDLAYLAPEVLNDPTHHGSKADVYAFGCLMYEVLSAQPAFPAAAFGGERRDQAQRMLEWKTRSDVLDPGEDCPDWLRNMIAKCTEPYPPRRLPDIDALIGWLDGAEESWRRKPRPAAPAQRRAPPPVLLPTRPSLRPAGSLPRAEISRAPQPEIPTYDHTYATNAPATPIHVQYMIAAALGVMGALGFSALIILFIELQNGSI